MRLSNSKYLPIKALSDFLQVEGDQDQANCRIVWEYGLIVENDQAIYILGKISPCSELKIEQESNFIWPIYTKPYSFYSFQESKRIEKQPGELNLFLAEYLRNKGLIGKVFRGTQTWYTNKFLLEDYRSRDQIDFYFSGTFSDDCPEELKIAASKLNSFTSNSNGKNYPIKSFADKITEKMNFLVAFYSANIGQDKALETLESLEQKTLYAWNALDEDARALISLLFNS